MSIRKTGIDIANLPPNLKIAVDEFLKKIQYDTMASHDEDHISTEKSISTRSIRKTGIDIANLPPNLKLAVDELNLDTDGDGRLDTQEIITAVEHLAAKTKANTSLKKIVYVLCGFFVVLVVALFGTSIAAARLAKDTTMDVDTGIMYAKGDAHNIMKTEEATSRSEKNIANMSNKELDRLMNVIMTQGDVKFQVKGYSRSGTIDENQVMLLVEGGTITFDPNGIMGATGDAESLLVFSYGDFTTEGGRRRLGINTDTAQADTNVVAVLFVLVKLVVTVLSLFMSHVFGKQII